MVIIQAYTSTAFMNQEPIFSDFRSKVMKFTSQGDEYRKAWANALDLFRESFGRQPQSEEDGKTIFKAAQRIVKRGGIPGNPFGQGSQGGQGGNAGGGGQGGGAQGGNAGGGGQGGGAQGGNSRQEGPINLGPSGNEGGQQGGSSGGVSAQDPVALFTAIRGLYKAGAISRDQVTRAFQQIVASAGLSSIAEELFD